MKRNRSFFGSIAGTILLSASVSLAQWSTDPTINTHICAAGGGQAYTAIVSDGRGGAIITWQDGRSNSSSGWDIYVQRIDIMGNPLWTHDGVPLCTFAGDQLYPAIAGDGAGGAIIAWWDKRGDTYSDIYAQRVDALGNTKWTTNGVPICTSTGDQVNPAPVSDGENGAIIAWQDKRSGTSWDIYALSIDSTGNPRWAQNGLEICTLPGDQRYPVVTNRMPGGAFIAWQSSPYIYAQSVDAMGSIFWAKDGIAVCPAPYQQQYQPSIVSDGMNGATIAWFGYGGGEPFGYDIFAQRVSSMGKLAWGTGGVVVCNAEQNQIYSKICNDTAGGVIITWQDPRYDAGDIYAQRVDAEGNLQWTATAIGVGVCTATGGQFFPVIASDVAGGAIIAWEDGRTEFDDIYAQRVGMNGVTKWASDGVPIGTATGVQRYPTLVCDGFGGAIITWWESRGIFAQYVNGDGQLGIVPPEAQTNHLIDEVEDLISGGVLNEGQGNALISKLQKVLNKLDQGNTRAAINILNAFINQVEAFIQSGKLTQAEGQLLIDAANSLIAQLSGLSKEAVPQLATRFAPTVSGLSQNYPNPFNPTTVINYQLAVASNVRLVVHDLLGREVSVLVNERKEAGVHEVQFDGSGLSSGVYFCRIEAGTFVMTRKILLLR